MIDAEEAEARDRAAAERHEAQARAAAERHEAQARAAAQKALFEQELARREAGDRVRSLGIEETANGNGRPDAREEARARKRAVRQLATLEKKEARERKALAKAAARRRSG
jgi:hypothetical protein